MKDDNRAGPGAEGSGAVDNADRRGRQRFVAQRYGMPCFWVETGGARFALNDLSLDGFSVAFPQPPVGEFDFVLQREGVPDRIHGHARAVNRIPGPLGPVFGCRFSVISPDNAARLEDWLIAHVIMSASVRITEKDAAAIVRGRSLV
ncbi:MAG: PilZ domain-containing protein [Thauera sp.]|nr:PilZ domain-containing protein [Thauera sp.]